MDAHSHKLIPNTPLGQNSQSLALAEAQPNGSELSSGADVGAGPQLGDVLGLVKHLEQLSAQRTNDLRQELMTLTTRRNYLLEQLGINPRRCPNCHQSLK